MALMFIINLFWPDPFLQHPEMDFYSLFFYYSELKESSGELSHPCAMSLHDNEVKIVYTLSHFVENSIPKGIKRSRQPALGHWLLIFIIDFINRTTLEKVHALLNPVSIFSLLHMQCLELTVIMKCNKFHPDFGFVL